MLSRLRELKKVTNASENVIIFVDKNITKIMKDNSDAYNKINNTTHIIVYENIKNIHET